MDIFKDMVVNSVSVLFTTRFFFQVIGVAQVINKDGGKGLFTKEDEEVGVYSHYFILTRVAYRIFF